MSDKLAYRPEIDGLRAIAVIIVVFYHAGFDWFSGGFVGVDVFFVISGYLITRILLNGFEDGSVTLAGFYARRARRILPALCTMAFVSLLAGFVILNPKALSDLSVSAIGVAVFVSNFVFWLKDGYFQESTEYMPLIHTWSLSVEEQFYISFPAVMFLILAKMRKGLLFTLIVIVLTGFVASVLMAYFVSHPRLQSAAFFLLPTRMWELGAGALLAATEGKVDIRSRLLREVGVGTGLALIFASVVLMDGQTPFPGAAAAVPVLGTVLFILSTRGGGLVGKALSTKVIVSVGLISYSLYLWHQPLFAFFRNYKNETHLTSPEALLLVSISLLMSVISWKYIEKPFRKRRDGNRFTIVTGLCASVIIALFAVPGVVIGLGYETYLAKKLIQSEFVVAENMNDAEFSWARLAHEYQPPGVIAVGSSRHMQLGSATLGQPMLNLSSSGAYISETVPLAAQSVITLQPDTLIIGVDPWLLNVRARRGRLGGARLNAGI